MAKKKPSLKAKSAATSGTPPPLTFDQINRMLDQAIMGGVADKGPPANQPSLIPGRGSAGMTGSPIPQGGMGQSGGFMNLMPQGGPPPGPPNRGIG
jgi:hypothetical protein